MKRRKLFARVGIFAFLAVFGCALFGFGCEGAKNGAEISNGDKAPSPLPVPDTQPKPAPTVQLQPLGTLGSVQPASQNLLSQTLTKTSSVAPSTLISSQQQDFGYAVTVDKDDNIYIVGSSTGSIDTRQSRTPGSAAMFVARYNPLGHNQWISQYEISNADIFGHDVVVTDHGVYAVGSVKYKGTVSPKINAIIMKLSLDGAIERVRIPEEDRVFENGNNVTMAVTADKSGNIYTAGYFEGTFFTNQSKGKKDIFVMKLSPDADYLMEAALFGTAEDDVANDLMVDDAGYVYTTGYSVIAGASVGKKDLLTVVWKKEMKDNYYFDRQSIVSDFVGLAIANDQKRNALFVAGDYTGSGKFGQFVLGYWKSLAESQQSSQLVQKSSAPSQPAQPLAQIDISAQPQQQAQPQALAQPQQQVQPPGTDPQLNLFEIKPWQAAYPGFGTNDISTDIAVDGNGNIYVVGESSGDDTVTGEKIGTKDIYLYKMALVVENSIVQLKILWGLKIGKVDFSCNGASLALKGDKIYVSGNCVDKASQSDVILNMFDLNGSKL